MRNRSMPVTDSRLPVGAMPNSSLSCTPLVVVATAIRSPSLIVSSIVTSRSPTCRNSSRNCLTPSGP
jgi:hypothetical protein